MGESKKSFNEFNEMWRGKTGIMYVIDHEEYNRIVDAVYKKFPSAEEIFDYAGADPYFSIHSRFSTFRLDIWMKPEWLNATVREFITINDGIFVFIDEPDR